MISFDFVKKTECTKKFRKNVYDFLLFCLKKTRSSISMRLLFLSIKSIYIKCKDFHDYNTSHHSHTPHVSSIAMRILFICFYLVCIVHFNAFIISIVEINVPIWKHWFHDNNNWLFLMLQVLYWFSVRLYRLFTRFLNFLLWIWCYEHPCYFIWQKYTTKPSVCTL